MGDWELYSYMYSSLIDGCAALWIYWNENHKEVVSNLQNHNYFQYFSSVSIIYILSLVKWCNEKSSEPGDSYYH